MSNPTPHQQRPPLDPQLTLPSLGTKYSSLDTLDGRDVCRRDLERWARESRPPIDLIVNRSKLVGGPSKLTIYGDDNCTRRFRDGRQLVSNEERCPFAIRLEKQPGHRWQIVDINNNHTQSCIRSRLQQPHFPKINTSNSTTPTSTTKSSVASTFASTFGAVSSSPRKCSIPEMGLNKPQRGDYWVSVPASSSSAPSSSSPSSSSSSDPSSSSSSDSSSDSSSSSSDSDSSDHKYTPSGSKSMINRNQNFQSRSKPIVPKRNLRQHQPQDEDDDDDSNHSNPNRNQNLIKKKIVPTKPSTTSFAFSQLRKSSIGKGTPFQISTMKTPTSIGRLNNPSFFRNDPGGGNGNGNDRAGEQQRRQQDGDGNSNCHNTSLRQTRRQHDFEPQGLNPLELQEKQLENSPFKVGQKFQHHLDFYQSVREWFSEKGNEAEEWCKEMITLCMNQFMCRASCQGLNAPCPFTIFLKPIYSTASTSSSNSSTSTPAPSIDPTTRTGWTIQHSHLGHNHPITIPNLNAPTIISSLSNSVSGTQKAINLTATGKRHGVFKKNRNSLLHPPRGSQAFRLLKGGDGDGGSSLSSGKGDREGAGQFLGKRKREGSTSSSSSTKATTATTSTTRSKMKEDGHSTPSTTTSGPKKRAKHSHPQSDSQSQSMMPPPPTPTTTTTESGLGMVLDRLKGEPKKDSERFRNVNTIINKKNRNTGRSGSNGSENNSNSNSSSGGSSRLRVFTNTSGSGSGLGSGSTNSTPTTTATATATTTMLSVSPINSSSLAPAPASASLSASNLGLKDGYRRSSIEKLNGNDGTGQNVERTRTPNPIPNGLTSFLPAISLNSSNKLTSAKEETHHHQQSPQQPLHQLPSQPPQSPSSPLYQLLDSISPKYAQDWYEPLISLGADCDHPEHLIELDEGDLMDVLNGVKRRRKVIKTTTTTGTTGTTRRRMDGKREKGLVRVKDETTHMDGDVDVKGAGFKEDGVDGNGDEEVEWIEMPPFIKIVLKARFKRMREKGIY